MCLLLQQGIGLVIVDVVTTRSANLHNELMARLGAPDAGRLQADLYAVLITRSSVRRQQTVDLWPETLALVTRCRRCHFGWRRLVLPVDLEAAYERTAASSE